MRLQNKRRPEAVRAAVLGLSVTLAFATAIGQWAEMITVEWAGMTVSLLAFVAAATISMVVPGKRKYDRPVIGLYILYSLSALFLSVPTYTKLLPTVESQTVGTTGLALLVPLTYYLYSRAVAEWFNTADETDR